jgi:hypothetical protein
MSDFDTAVYHAGPLSRYPQPVTSPILEAATTGTQAL